MLLSNSRAHARVAWRAISHSWHRQYRISADSLAALDAWIESPDPPPRMYDTFTVEKLEDLYITLPTRDRKPHPHTPAVRGYDYRSRVSPEDGEDLPHGHHLAFFHRHTPESLLRPDGTDPTACPPEPFSRRMWAGGRMEWSTKIPLDIGDSAYAESEIIAAEKKGFGAEGKTPMVFVTQRIMMRSKSAESSVQYHHSSSIVEERTHVYLPLGAETNRAVRKIKDLPEPSFSFTYTPTPMTLFRFSALTFNGHYIHLDREYAQQVEGYPERLVHAPLTALMMLETLAFHKSDVLMKTFEYRAVNPIIVNRPCIIHGSWDGHSAARLWVEDGDGVVGMTGRVTFTTREELGTVTHMVSLLRSRL